MIKSKKDYKYYLEADRIARALPRSRSINSHFKDILFPDYLWQFQKLLRKLEYFINCKKGIISTIYRLLLTKRFYKLSLKLGFSIPANVFGPGLSIAHPGTIIVNGGSKIGNNCRLHACVNIGTKAGYTDKAPTIGDNCYIGPGVKLYGGINIADGIAIGANAVVNKSFSETGIMIAGVPAKKIAKIDTFDYLIPATQIIEKGINNTIELGGMNSMELKERLKGYDIYEHN